jgi:hypothetical protein
MVFIATAAITIAIAGIAHARSGVIATVVIIVVTIAAFGAAVQRSLSAPDRIES